MVRPLPFVLPMLMDYRVIRLRQKITAREFQQLRQQQQMIQGTLAIQQLKPLPLKIALRQ